MTGAAPLDVVFDLDGTLVDSVSHCTAIMNAMLAERGSGRRIGEAEARPHITLGGPRMIEALLAHDCGDPDREIADFRARYAAMPTPPGCLFPGVREGLTELAEEGYRLSVCSNKPQALCEKVLDDLGLAGLFSAVVGSDGVLPLKPHPALLMRTLALTGGEARRCCYVGDAEVDVQLARAAGSALVFLTYGYADPAFVHDSPFNAHRFADAPQQIRFAMKDLWSRLEV
jgi:phosphoglycolate phosphatase